MFPAPARARSRARPCLILPEILVMTPVLGQRRMFLAF